MSESNPVAESKRRVVEYVEREVKLRRIKRKYAGRGPVIRTKLM